MKRKLKDVKLNSYFKYPLQIPLEENKYPNTAQEEKQSVANLRLPSVISRNVSMQ
jgi:hypothetical protein